MTLSTESRLEIFISPETVTLLKERFLCHNLIWIFLRWEMDDTEGLLSKIPFQLIDNQIQVNSASVLLGHIWLVYEMWK